MVVALKENDGSNVSHHSLNQGQRVFMTLSKQGSSKRNKEVAQSSKVVNDLAKCGVAYRFKSSRVKLFTNMK